MGCFFTCFRIKDDRSASTPGSATRRRDDLVSKNRLSSLFLCEEEDPFNERNSNTDGIDRELKQEVKLLKACGAISETPIEIRKISKKFNCQGKADDDLPSDSQPNILGDSCNKLEWGEQTHKVPSFPATKEETNIQACNSARSAASIKQLENKTRNSLSFLLCDPQNEDFTTQSRLFEAGDYQENNSNLKLSSSKISTPEVDNSRKSDLKPESVSNFGSSKIETPQVDFEGIFPRCTDSPFPTPLNLSDEMQTPGTVYTTNLDNLVRGRNAHVRTQYVYPVVQPVKEIPQDNVQNENGELLKFGGSNLQDRDVHEKHNLEKPVSLNPNHMTCDQVLLVEDCYSSSAAFNNMENIEIPLNSSGRCSVVQISTPVVESLSQWLKPLAPESERRRNREAVKKEISDSDRDRPIIGTVAAHWNEEETSNISPKWWDGNGIPNSTNKYKEDQKVSWHATPFEERLEKALSEENIYPERILKASPINFDDENEESDTAAS